MIWGSKAARCCRLSPLAVCIRHWILLNEELVPTWCRFLPDTHPWRLLQQVSKIAEVPRSLERHSVCLSQGRLFKLFLFFFFLNPSHPLQNQKVAPHLCSGHQHWLLLVHIKETPHLRPAHRHLEQLQFCWRPAEAEPCRQQWPCSWAPLSGSVRLC